MPADDDLEHQSTHVVEAVPMVDAKPIVIKDNGITKTNFGMLNNRCKNFKKKIILFGAGASLLIVIIISVVALMVVGGSDRDTNKSSSTQEQSQQCQGVVEVFDMSKDHQLWTDAPFLSNGCFHVQGSVDRHTIEGRRNEEKASACSDQCLTMHFSVAGNTCFCYVEAPLKHLTIGECDTTACEDSTQKMV
jgi:hypothetical protein